MQHLDAFVFCFQATVQKVQSGLGSTVLQKVVWDFPLPSECRKHSQPHFQAMELKINRELHEEALHCSEGCEEMYL